MSVCVRVCVPAHLHACVCERERGWGNLQNYMSTKAVDKNTCIIYFTGMGWWTKEYSAADAAEMAIHILSHEENFVQCILWRYDHNTALCVSCWTTFCSVVLQIPLWSKNCRKRFKILLIVTALHWRLKKNNKARSMSYCAISAFPNIFLPSTASFCAKGLKNIFYNTNFFTLRPGWFSFILCCQDLHNEKYTNFFFLK